MSSKDSTFFIDSHAVSAHYAASSVAITRTKVDSTAIGDKELRLAGTMQNLRIMDAVALDLGYMILAHLLGWPEDVSRSNALIQEAKNVG